MDTGRVRWKSAGDSEERTPVTEDDDLWRVSAD